MWLWWQYDLRNPQYAGCMECRVRSFRPVHDSSKCSTWFICQLHHQRCLLLNRVWKWMVWCSYKSNVGTRLAYGRVPAAQRIVYTCRFCIPLSQIDSQLLVTSKVNFLAAVFRLFHVSRQENAGRAGSFGIVSSHILVRAAHAHLPTPPLLLRSLSPSSTPQLFCFLLRTHTAVCAPCRW
jgi:hypothetical protein